MKKLLQSLAILGVGGALLLSAERAQAQNRGNFDPAQFQQQMLERMREQFDVKNDDEWKLISARITKVMEARRETLTIGFGGFGRGGGPGGAPGGGTRPQGGDNKDGQQGGRTRGGFGGTPNPDVEALQKAIQDKAPADEVKAKLEKVRAARKAGEAKLAKAQEELKAVLTARQEAVAVIFGLLS